MNYELIEKEMLELAIKEQEEYYDYIKLNEYKARVLDLIVKEINICPENVNKILESYCRTNSF